MKRKYLEKADLTARYQLLGRLVADCEYYLGAGNKQVKNLWSGSVDQQIEDMKELYLSFSQEERPEWLSYAKINEFSEKMDHRLVISDDDLGEAR